MEEQTMEQPSIQEITRQATEEALAEVKKQAMLDRLAEARKARKPKAKKVKEKPVIQKKVETSPPPVAPVVMAPVQDEKIMFFTESDIDKKTGKIVNTYPSYFNRKQKEDLEEEIRRLETGLDNNYFPRERVGEVKEQLRKAKTAYEKTLEIKPHFEKNKDTIFKMVNDLGDNISRSMFTRTEMAKGLADSHEEARRMSEPIIELDDRAAQIAQDNGIRIHDGRKVTRSDAVRLWQFGRYALGEMRDAEVLRRD